MIATQCSAPQLCLRPVQLHSEVQQNSLAGVVTVQPPLGNQGDRQFEVVELQLIQPAQLERRFGFKCNHQFRQQLGGWIAGVFSISRRVFFRARMDVSLWFFGLFKRRQSLPFVVLCDVNKP